MYPPWTPLLLDTCYELFIYHQWTVLLLLNKNIIIYINYLLLHVCIYKIFRVYSSHPKLYYYGNINLVKFSIIIYYIILNSKVLFLQSKAPDWLPHNCRSTSQVSVATCWTLPSSRDPLSRIQCLPVERLKSQTQSYTPFNPLQRCQSTFPKGWFLNQINLASKTLFTHNQNFFENGEFFPSNIAIIHM